MLVRESSAEQSPNTLHIHTHTPTHLCHYSRCVSAVADVFPLEIRQATLHIYSVLQPFTLHRIGHTVHGTAVGISLCSGLDAPGTVPCPLCATTTRTDDDSHRHSAAHPPHMPPPTPPSTHTHTFSPPPPPVHRTEQFSRLLQTSPVCPTSPSSRAARRRRLSGAFHSNIAVCVPHTTIEIKPVPNLHTRTHPLASLGNRSHLRSRVSACRAATQFAVPTPMRVRVRTTGGTSTAVPFVPHNPGIGGGFGSLFIGHQLLLLLT